MIITLAWGLIFCILMFWTGIFLLLYYLVKLFLGNNISERFAFFVTRLWGRITILTTLSRVRVIGSQNLVRSGKLCIISNHQSLFDIPLLTGWLGIPFGFIAKQELRYIPVISGWIRAIHSIFIDRSNPRKGIISIHKGVESIRNGHAIALFPEGTRSKDGKMAEFKTGSLKLATNAEAIIQPVSIQGTRHIYEETGRIHKSHLTLIIHPAVYPNDDMYKNKSLLSDTLHQIILVGTE